MTEAIKHWMAVYTKPRSEKKVAERLEQSGVEVYCPLQTTVRQWSDRKKKVKIPVFPSYVFVHIEESMRLKVLQDPGVMNFVFWLGKPAVIRDEEIQTVRSFLDLTHIEEIEMANYKVGDQVDIIAGSFAGYKGKAINIEAKSITLLIESLGAVLKIKVSIKLVYNN